jgi:hypothetical protein
MVRPLVTGCSLLLAACAAPIQHGPPGQPPSVDGGEVALSGLEALVGDYALRTVVATLQTIPLAGETSSRNLSYAVARVELEQGHLVLVQRGCRVIVESSGPMSVTVPDAMIRSIPEQRSPVDVVEDAEGLAFSRPEAVTLVGAQLADPVGDPLPSGPDDPAVIDQEPDGKPGATIRMSGVLSGDIYLAQRLRSAYHGRIDASRTWVGQVVDRTEQKVLGSSNPLLASDIPTRQDPDATRSEVRLVPLAGPMDCDELAAQREGLFPPP